MEDILGNIVDESALTAADLLATARDLVKDAHDRAAQNPSRSDEIKATVSELEAFIVRYEADPEAFDEFDLIEEISEIGVLIG